MQTEPMINLQNLSLENAINDLRKFEARKIDLVVPSKQLAMVNNMIEMTTRPGVFEPTFHMHRQIGTKLNIPATYYDLMARDNPGLLDTNVNSWLGRAETNHLIRLFNPEDDGGIGIGRAFLSDRYRCIDNLPIVITAIQAMAKSGVHIMVEQADISDTKLYIRFTAPEAIIDAREFVKRYRHPETGALNTGVVAGYILTNSEVGDGALAIMPYAVVQVCSNGMVGKKYAQRKTHLGGKLDTGEINWSTSTKMANMELIQKQIQDYILEFTSVEFLKKWLDELEHKANVPVLHPMECIASLAPQIGVKDDEIQKVLELYYKSADMTVGGIGQAVTYFAKSVNADRRFELEASFENILSLAPEFDRKK